MQKPGIVQAYKNWMYVQTIRHFTQPQADQSDTRPLDRCRFIPLKQLHEALDWEIKKHLFMRYVVPPVVAGIVSVATLAIITHKNLS